jgi:CHAT domain-containing protein
VLLGALAACDPGATSHKATKRSASNTAGLRPGPGRLAGLPWAPVAPRAAPRAATAGVRRWLVTAVPTPRADAIAALLAGHVDRAIAQLAAAAERSPRDATLLSDLAAAHLQQAATVADAEDLVSALAAASRAVDLDALHPSARFNRAVALESLSLRAQAADDWVSYLAAETDPAWRAEARAHLRTLRQVRTAPDTGASRAELLVAAEQQDRQAVDALVVRWPQLCRETVEGELLPAWAEAVLTRKEATATRTLAATQLIAAALTAHGGDRLLADTLADLTQRQAAGPAPLRRVAAGLRAYRSGLELLLRGDFSHALAALERSRELLAKPRSPFLGWAEYRMAVCHYMHWDYRAVTGLLAPLIAGAKDYRALHGRCLWLVGGMEDSRGNPIGSIAATEAAIADFAAVREAGYVARMRAQLATEQWDLGRLGATWQALYQALLEPATHPAERSTICTIAAWYAVAQGKAEAARWFHDETLRVEYARSDYSRVDVLRREASFHAARGEQRAALADLGEAQRLLDRMLDTFARRGAQADILLQQARLLRGDAPLAAIPRLDAAIRTFRANSYHHGLSQALFERALAEKAAGQEAALGRDLAAAIAESERQRARIPDFETRIEYFSRTRAVLDEMIAFQLTRGRAPSAFRYSERARARVLLDWLLTQSADDPSLHREAGVRATTALAAARRPALPAGTVLIEYALLPDRLVLWILRGSTLTAKTIPIDPAALATQVAALRQSIREGRKSQWLDAASKLFEVLIAPALPALAPADRLVFVPDGALHGLPFAVLRDPKTGRYLCQDHIIGVAPSARIFLTALRHDAALAALPGSAALVVADPAFDRELYPSLRRLAGAAAEASEIASTFAGSRVLRAEAASKAAFLSAARDFRLVHFAGHAVVNPEAPLLSQLLFARDPADRSRGLLYSGELLGLHLPRTRLVVLASCRTATGRVSRTEGVESLARPFLATGVPAVVASLWDVEDAGAAAFMRRFYRHLQRSFDVAAALQAAQVEALAEPSGATEGVGTWAAFELIGASSNPR